MNSCEHLFIFSFRLRDDSICLIYCGIFSIDITVFSIDIMSLYRLKTKKPQLFGIS